MGPKKIKRQAWVWYLTASLVSSYRAYSKTSPWAGKPAYKKLRECQLQRLGPTRKWLPGWPPGCVSLGTLGTWIFWKKDQSICNPKMPKSGPKFIGLMVLEHLEGLEGVDYHLIFDIYIYIDRVNIWYIHHTSIYLDSCTNFKISGRWRTNNFPTSSWSCGDLGCGGWTIPGRWYQALPMGNRDQGHTNCKV